MLTLLMKKDLVVAWLRSQVKGHVADGWYSLQTLVFEDSQPFEFGTSCGKLKLNLG
jgi:hypothetical protein